MRRLFLHFYKSLTSFTPGMGVESTIEFVLASVESLT